jgi:serine/threonine-protein kinase
MICPHCSIGDIPPDTHECPLCGFSPSSNVLVEHAAADEARQAVQQALGDRFRIEQTLKLGVRSFVYRATDLHHERIVALKVIPVPQLVDHELAKRFERQVELAAGLKHSHIIPVYLWGATRTFLWYALEVVPDESLDEALRASGPMPFDRVLRIAEQIGSALDYGHRNGVMHGNLKPSNVFLNAAGWVRVSDFAILEAFGRPRGTRAAGPILQVPEYMAPEQFYARSVGASADQYALAVITYQCLTGTVPFVGDSFDEVARQHADVQPPRLSGIRRDIPVTAMEAVTRALSKVPTGRFQTVLDFTAALSGARRHSAATTVPGAARRPSRSSGSQTASTPVLVMDAERRLFSPRRVAGATAAVLVLALGAVALWQPAVVQRTIDAVRGIAGTEAPSSAPEPRWDVLDPLPGQDRVSEAGDDSLSAAVDAAPEPAAAAPEATQPTPPRPVTPGTLTIASRPWGRLSIDGEPMGNTPKPAIELRPGRYTVRVERDGYTPFEQVVRIRSGQTLRLTDITLEPLN